MFKEDYRSGTEKISADAAWKQRTLAAMQAAEADPAQTTQAMAGGAQRKKVMFSRKLLLTAAAIALLAVPSLCWYGIAGGLQAAGTAPKTAAAVQSAPEALDAGTGAAADRAEDAVQSSMAAVPEAMCEGAVPSNAETGTVFSARAAATLRDEAQATEALLRGEAYCTDATEAGGYETEGLLVLQCVLLSAEDAENEFGVPMYRFTVQYETDAQEKSDKSIQPDAELWVSAQES